MMMIIMIKIIRIQSYVVKNIQYVTCFWPAYTTVSNGLLSLYLW